MNDDSVSFTVPGVPVPQGSKQIVRRGGKSWMINANDGKLRPWRAEVARVAEAAAGGRLFDSPVSVGYEFVFPRPKRPKFTRHAVKPDADKLIRAVNDALTDSGLISDDSRIFETFAVKRYAEPGEAPHARVTVTPW